MPMFHRSIRLLFLSALFLTSFVAIAADCPDTQPRITGPDVVGAGSSWVQYITPLVTGHTYAWVVTTVPGGNIVTTSSSNVLSLQWNTPGDYLIELTEGIAGNTCLTTATPLNVLVRPMLAAYFYYEFDATHGCYYNEVNFTATGDGNYPPQDNSISYDWKWREYGTTVWTNEPSGSVRTIVFPSISGITYEVNLHVAKTISGRIWEDEITDFVYVDPDRYKPTAEVTSFNTILPNCAYNPYTFSAAGSLAVPSTNPDPTVQIKYCDWYVNGVLFHHSGNGIIIPCDLTATYTFPSPGSYDITVRVENTLGCYNTSPITTIVVANTVPVASFTNTSACIGESTLFTNTSMNPVGAITQLEWVFGDGNSYSGTDPNEIVSHTYQSLGFYTATLTVKNSNNCLSEVFTKAVNVNPAPMASFLVGTACLGQAVAFTNTSTLNGGSQITDFLWTFDDPGSGSNTSTATNPTHMFSAVGSYNVSLQATNSDGCANTYVITPPLVVSPVPDVNFTYQYGTQNWQILFHNLTGPGVGNNLVWDFGDGTYGYGPDPSHVYQGPGNFLVTLTATDAITGCANSIQQLVVIQGTASAFFTSDTPKCIGDTMHFIPQIPGGNIVREVWDFGDGVIVTFDATSVPPPVFPIFATHVYLTANTWTVTRTVTYNTNFFESFSIQVVVYPLPTANYTYSNNSTFPNLYACANQTVYFTDLSFSSSGNIIAWAWDFGDPGSGSLNNFSVLQNPSHVFSGTNTTYHVKLTVTDNVNNCTDTLTRDIFVNPPVPVEFSFANNACMGEVVTFNADLSVMVPANIATWDWDFGDGTTHSANPLSASHMYATPGIYNAVLTVTDLNGCTNSLVKPVNVMPKPVPGFTFASPTCDSVAVQFTDQSYVPAGFPGFIDQWTWYWGDGSFTTVNQPGSPNVSHIFPGNIYSFNVKLVVRSSFGCIDSITRQVNLIPAPIVSFEVVAGTPSCATQVVQFHDLTQINGGGDLVSWLWNFDDPGSGSFNTSTSPDPSHIFAAAGTYRVSLRVTNANSCSHADTIPVVVNMLPVANFKSDTACAGGITQFTDLSVFNATAITSYNWDFGDGGTSTLQSPQHAYATFGIYTATLTVINSNGCTHSVTKQVIVNPNPVPAFTFSAASCIGNPVSYTDLSFIPSGYAGYIKRWIWNFDDGTLPVTIDYPNSPNISHTFAGVSTSHNVKLIIITTTNCTDSLVRTVNSIPSPVSNFSASNTTCIGQTVQFTDLSQTNGGGSIQSWTWNFSDPLSGANNTSALPNPTHSFTGTGPFLVTLTVTSANGCTNTYDSTITINELPVASFTNDDACEGKPTTFTDASTTSGTTTIISYAWTFGDGGTSTLQSPQHTYAAYGTYPVTLTIVNSNGCIHMVSRTVLVNPKPIAGFSFSSTSCVGNPVDFFNQSFVPAGYSSFIQSWEWDFDDGTGVVTIPYPNNPNITHTFAGTSTIHNVKLKVTTTTGCLDSIVKTVNSVPSPKANFAYANVTCDNEPIQFTDLSQTNGGGSIQSWNWNFGDPLSGANNSATVPNPVHQFTTFGPFTVTLTVTNGNGCYEIKDTLLNVNQRPVANFTADSACQGSPTTFNSGTTIPNAGSIVSYSWDFGDGGVSAGQNPQHIYATYGYFNVTLTVVNSNGCSHSVTRQIVVNPKPIADFTFSATVCMGNPVSFFDQSTIPTGYSSYINQWIWDFGDGSTPVTIDFPASSNVTHTFLGTSPSHVVRLTVRSTKGCISFIEKTVNSVLTPVANFSYSNTVCDHQPVQFTDLTQTNGGGNIQTWSWNFGDPASGSNNTSSAQNPVHLFSSSGPFSITLIVTNGNGCKDTLLPLPVVNVNARPFADFHADTVCLGTPSTFTDLSTPGGTIVSYLWDFGDGQTATSGNPTHLYATAGNFNVRLTVTSSQGCIKDTLKPILVLGKPISAFSYSSPNCAGDSVQFTDLSSTPHGSIRRWTWDFGDATPPVVVNFPGNQNVKHAFANGGIFNVTLTIKTSDSCEAQIINPVQVGFSPLANFTFGNSGCALTPLQFTDLSQLNGGPAITAWSWDFDDPASGTSNTSNAQNPTHAFTAGGNYMVLLTVTNANGCTSVDSNSVTINVAPVAIFSADTACMASPTQFTDESTTSAGNIVAWAWNFGDPASGSNNTSTMQNPTHIFSMPGTYTVTLQVTNTAQCPKDTSMVVSVNPKPVSMFEYSPSCVLNETQFTDLSIAPGSVVNSWSWDFDDGTPLSTDQNPVHIFTTPGTYMVKLVVANLSNCEDSVIIPVISRPTPVAAFTSVGFFCPAGKVDFQDVSTASAAAIASRLWIFEPGYTSTLPNPTYIFPVTNMKYAVMLIVTDTYGCMDTIVDSVFVKPGFAFTFRNDTVCEGYATKFTPINQAAGDTLYSVTWNFGDPTSGPNNTSQAYSPTHVFTGPGTFTVRMKAYNSDNCVDSVYREVNVYEAPHPLFSFLSTPCDSTIYFSDSTLNSGSGSIASWQWSFGDGSAPVTINAPGPGDISHLYVNAGFYTVSLIMTNSNGCIDSISRVVQRFPCIKAGFAVGDTLCARYKIAFADSSLPVSRINQWHWTWGDGTDTTYTVHSSPVFHTYANSGTYNVTLEIQAMVSGTNIVDNMMNIVTVHPTPLTYFSNVPVCLNQMTLFRDTSSTFGAPVTEWNWTLGTKPTDTSTLKNPSHRYDTAGIYDVKLVVMNSFGCKDSLTKPTRVYGLPEAHYENTAACVGDPTFFTDISVKSDTTLAFWRWSFGDPTTMKDTSNLKDPVYKYPNTGDFDIRMIVRDRYGCIDTVDSTVRVNVTPLSSFTVADNYNGKQGQVKINNVSTGADSYRWDFGNGSYSTEENPVALFTDDGNYSIRLIATNQYDCADTTYYEYQLKFKGLYVPNAFAPSSNILQDRLFQPKGINLTQYHVMVFDVWGHLMWESTKLDTDTGSPVEGWDGTFEGNLMPQGNYMWKIKALFVDGSQWEGSDIGVGGSGKTMGTVTLIR